jgi:hypothetical protein
VVTDRRRDEKGRSPVQDETGSGRGESALVEKAFAELNEQRPDGLRYATLRLADGVTFVHVAVIESDDGSNPLGESEAFAGSNMGSKTAAPSHRRRMTRPWSGPIASSPTDARDDRCLAVEAR